MKQCGCINVRAEVQRANAHNITVDGYIKITVNLKKKKSSFNNRYLLCELKKQIILSRNQSE